MGTNQLLKDKHEVPLLESTTLKVLCKHYKNVVFYMALEIERKASDKIRYIFAKILVIFNITRTFAVLQQVVMSEQKNDTRIETRTSVLQWSKSQQCEQLILDLRFS